MTEITRTVNEVIENAYKIIGEFSEDNPLTQDKTVDALKLLNQLLDSYASTPARIAYDSLLTFNLVIDQTDYIFSRAIGADVDSDKIIRIKYITLKNADVIYPVHLDPDEVFFNNIRDENRSHRPRNAYFQNQMEGSKLVFFTKPDVAYECTIKAKFIIDEVTLNTPLIQIPANYHRFLNYALAKELNSHFEGSIWDNKREQIYQTELRQVSDYSDLDLTARTGAALKPYTRGVSRGEFFSGY